MNIKTFLYNKSPTYSHHWMLHCVLAAYMYEGRIL